MQTPPSLRLLILPALVLIPIAVPAASPAMPPFLIAWEERYPESTLPSRMATLTGSACNTCHHPTQRYYAGSCYRETLRTLLNTGIEIDEAIELADGMDSDSDGIPNGVEILMPRSDMAGEVGYHPGLVGIAGTDPCYDDPDEIVTAMDETPPATFCAAELTGDGLVDFADYLEFLNRYEAEDLSIDYTGDGLVDFGDYLEFLNHYDAGC